MITYSVHVRHVHLPRDVQFCVSAPTQGYVYVLKRGGSLLLCNNGRAFLETRSNRPSEPTMLS
ncbi:glycosyl transferase [Bifidobacterium adolescentis ATCC 15703]|uniref:Glycosyl transferase n=1 Tax=Bifidobacterium adolescentis (strain ATCC 15703 / DSM 20083 / NCTC 11814 / E194a) TaxID=367928 RepID=A1A223_BIFAA|nr:glycosyl transferase [Bifidobacterium adolescentis ATCC 15703]